MRIAASLALLSAAFALGACAVPEVEGLKAPDSSTLFRQFSVTSYKEKQLGPVAAEDLVDAGGRCAGAFVPPASGGEQPPTGDQPTVGNQPPADHPHPFGDHPRTADQSAGQTEISLQQAGVPLIPAAVGLDMSECDVVKRAGLPEQVQIGANERNERTAVLTYIHGPRPGIYHFASGRLKSMERAPEPPPPPKPVRSKKRSSKPKRAAR